MEEDIEVHNDEQTFAEFMQGMFPKEQTNGMPTKEWLQSKFKTKSAIIRFLNAKGYSTKEIALHMGIRQQHARNVIGQELKRGPNESYQEIEFACSHGNEEISFVDVILRKNARDTNQSRILYRVCTKCAVSLIPGVNEEAINKHLPGAK